MNADFVDNSAQLLVAFRDACERGLWRCGEKAEEYAKDLAPVDTGNLRGSITHAEYAEAGGGRPVPWCYQDEQGLCTGRQATGRIRLSNHPSRGMKRRILIF